MFIIHTFYYIYIYIHSYSNNILKIAYAYERSGVAFAENRRGYSEESKGKVMGIQYTYMKLR